MTKNKIVFLIVFFSCFFFISQVEANQYLVALVAWPRLLVILTRMLLLAIRFIVQLLIMMVHAKIVPAVAGVFHAITLLVGVVALLTLAIIDA